MDAVVTHIANATENDALGEAARTVGIAGPQLPQHRDQRVPDESVDLVDQQNNRFLTRFGPGAECQEQHLWLARVGLLVELEKEIVLEVFNCLEFEL